MSEESIFIPVNGIIEPALNQVLSCFEKTGMFRVIEQNSIEGGMSCTYAFDETSRLHWPEDFLVSVKEQEVYLCFYSATSQQRAAATQLLATCLANAGAEGHFEEL